MKTFKKIKKNKGGFTHTLNFSKRSLVCGFTLVETMVAIFILSMALTALLGLISSSLFYSRYSRNEITANYLLQEVVDSIKNERDSAILAESTGGWDTFVGKYIECSGLGCLFVPETGFAQATTCSDDDCIYSNNRLYYDENASDGSFYNYTSPTQINSNFARKVVVTNTGDEVDVIVTVFWMNGTVRKSKSLSSSLLNWQ